MRGPSPRAYRARRLGRARAIGPASASRERSTGAGHGASRALGTRGEPVNSRHDFRADTLRSNAAHMISNARGVSVKEGARDHGYPRTGEEQAPPAGSQEQAGDRAGGTVAARHVQAGTADEHGL